MKKTLLLFAAASAALLLAASCKKDDDSVKTVSATIKVDESGIAPEIEVPASYTISLTNSTSGKAYTAETENGSATFTDLVPGTYAVTAAAAQTVGFYRFTGSAPAVSILKDGAEVSVSIETVKESSLIIKEAFIAGNAYDLTDPSDIWSGKTYFRDQFWEIYNNGTETVYADGVGLAQILYADWNYSTIYQFDIPNPNKYVYVQTVWQIQGSGTDYPIKPGESFIVAQWATDHNAEHLANGHGVNTSSAEFEAIEGEGTAGWGASAFTITDGPAINMKRAVNAAGYNAPQWLVSTEDAALVMFRPSKELDNENFLTASNNEYTQAREIAINDVLDAVQWYAGEDIWNDATKRNLPAVLDAGYAQFSAYCGKGIARKVASTRTDGTKVYQDTNNSSEDFELVAPQLRRDGAKIPSWNTWAK